MDNQQDIIATEPASNITCVGCKKQIDVRNMVSFSSVNCPDCGEAQIVPAHFGSFVLLGQLGSGGMGVIYHAMDCELGRHVALKVIKKSLGENSEFVKSFKHEAQAAAALNHPNIVQIYSFSQHKSQPYIVMELVSGGGLDEMIVEQERIDEAEALKIHIEVAEGLKAASDVGLVHGDIKPANILFGVHGEAKVVDFGLASFIGQQHDAGEPVMGTPYYIAPEKARKKKVDFRSDIYSLGATMFHVLAGQPPFDGETPLDVVMARLNNPAPSLIDFREDINPQTVAMIARMLEMQPTMRYPSYPALLYDMREALSAVRSAAESNGKTRIINKTLPVVGSNQTSSNFDVLKIVLGSLLLVGGVVAGGILYRNHQEKLAIEAVEKSALNEAATRGVQAYSRSAQRIPEIYALVEKTEWSAENTLEIAMAVEGTGRLTSEVKNHLDKMSRAIDNVSEVIERVAEFRSVLENAEDSGSAVHAADMLVSLDNSLGEVAKEVMQSFVAIEQARENVSLKHEEMRVAAKEAREQARKQAEQARREAELERAREETQRSELFAKQEAERIKRETIQRELDLIDKARGANARLVSQRKFDEAIDSFTSSVPTLTMPETKAAYDNVLDAYKAISELKRFIIRSIRQRPYPGGWVMGRSQRDIVDADPDEGVHIALGAAGSTVIPWNQITVMQWLRIATHYAKSNASSQAELADLLLSMSLFCYENGDFKKAEAAVISAYRLNPDLKADAERMMPGLLPKEPEEQPESEDKEEDQL